MKINYTIKDFKNRKVTSIWATEYKHDDMDEFKPIRDLEDKLKETLVRELMIKAYYIK